MDDNIQGAAWNGNAAAKGMDEALGRVLEWSRQQAFKGHNKHDGLNSPILRTLLGWGRWPRLVAIQSVMRFPVNPRTLLLVPRTYNPKGLALFSQGFLDLYRARRNPEHLQESERLLSLLLDLRAPGAWSGDCWGYPYPWQDLGFYAPANMPNAVVTSFVCEAFLDAYRETGKARYLETVASAVNFFLEDLPVLRDTPGELCLAYMPVPMRMRVLDVSILVGAVLAQYAAFSGSDQCALAASRLVRYVVSLQTDYGAWYYTDPPQDSPIRHDNYHTGFILDALARYMTASSDREWGQAYCSGLDFYAAELFNHDGSPRWMSDRDFPHDVHGAAQGILTFSRHRADFPGLADRIAAWTLRNLYDGKGRFYYQQTRYFTKRFTLLRWCNAWMARALAAQQRAREASNADRDLELCTGTEQ